MGAPKIFAVQFSYVAGAADGPGYIGGCTQILFWEDGVGRYYEHALALKAEKRLGGWKSGGQAWGQKGVAVNVTKSLYGNTYLGDKFDNTVAAIIPKNESLLPAIFCFIKSDAYAEELEKIDSALSVTGLTLLKVPFNLEFWQRVAAERYPNGLPKPYSDDPTQWLFHGHPQPTTDPLQVAVARLVGYR